MKNIKPGDIFIHIKSNEKYKVIGLANTTATKAGYPVTVIYRRLNDNTVWAKQIEEFKEKFRMADTPAHKKQ